MSRLRKSPINNIGLWQKAANVVWLPKPGQVASSLSDLTRRASVRQSLAMSNFRLIDRETGFVMPPSVDEWLPARHLVRFVAEVIATLDVRSMTGSYRGSGEASYHPQLLLRIIVYGYATGIFSSRKLKHAT